MIHDRKQSIWQNPDQESTYNQSIWIYLETTLPCNNKTYFCLKNVCLFSEVVEHACSITSLQMGETVSQITKDMDTYSYRVPLGVCAGITPYVDDYDVA